MTIGNELDDATLLLKLARKSITHVLKKTEFTKEELDQVKHLNQKQGVFVTVKLNGQLRGCIGIPEPVLPLYMAVIDAARSAAFSDTRFPTLTKEELKDIKLELSILTQPKQIRVKDPSEYPGLIEIGRHGLIISNKGRSGLLLPQVPSEQGWTVNQYLNAISQKAGLAFKAWQEPESRLFTFEAKVFIETDGKPMQVM